MEETKNNSKGLIVLVIFLIICILGLSSYIVYDKMLNKTTPTTDNTKSSTTKQLDNNNGYDKIAEKLESELITKDKSMGLYLDKKISINDTNNENFIIFNLKKYLEDKNIIYTNSDYRCGSSTGNDDYFSYDTIQEIEKEELNKYINKKYNTNNNYILNYQNKALYFNVASDMVHVTDNSYRIICEASSGEGKLFYNNLLSYEKKEHELILYDKAMICEDLIPSVSCKSNNKEYYSCSWDNNDCSDLEDKALKILNEKNDIQKYKHTFKIYNNNYYWVESEPIFDKD